jgi:ATP-dependent Clp protease adaptor protein ClpS
MAESVDKPVEPAPPAESKNMSTETRPSPTRPAPKVLPPWKVLLHNDEINEIDYVVETVRMLTPLPKEDAINRTLEAHRTGVALLLTTHQERAELYAQQFASRNLTVTIEIAE